MTINMNKVLAVIPARAGSKGLPGKNFKIIHGKPLIEWSIEAARQSKIIDDIVVSSNDPEIKRIVDPMDDIGYIDRPDELSSSTSTSEEALLHALDIMGDCYSTIVLLQPTSPARKNNLIDKCLYKLFDTATQSCFTTSRHTPFFYHLENGSYRYLNFSNHYLRYGSRRPMRQELQHGDYLFHDNGNVYVTKSKWLKEHKNRISLNPSIVETGTFCSMQIDTEEDFIVMEALADVYGGFL